MDSQDFVGPIFHPLVATAFVFRHNRCCRGGGTDYSQRSEPLHVLTIHDKVLQFVNCDKSCSLFFSQLFELNEGALIFSFKQSYSCWSSIHER
jgi:hypothetical protein